MSSVSVAGIASGSKPKAQLTGKSGPFRVNGDVHWNGTEIVSQQTGESSTPLREDLRDVESRLFQHSSFQASLDELNTIEDEVERSSFTEIDQADLLHEIYYHQAICYRKLVDLRRAETILSAFQRSDPDSPWGNLAGSWLGGSGLPHSDIRLDTLLQWHH